MSQKSENTIIRTRLPSYIVKLVHGNYTDVGLYLTSLWFVTLLVKTKRYKFELYLLLLINLYSLLSYRTINYTLRRLEEE